MGVAEKRKSLAEPAKPKLLGGTAIKPPERHGWEKISYLLYNKDTGEILTRTPKSWALIFIFYVIYYSLLAGFWYGMLQLFMLSVPVTEPKYTQGASIIGNNPGVGMQPPQADEKLDSSMLFLVYNSPTGEQPTDPKGEGLKNADWAARYKLYLESYKNKTKGVTTNCKDINPERQFCKFDPAVELGECAQYPYGYLGTVEPCVMLKINRIYGWEPQQYTDEELKDAQELDEDYPEDQMPAEIAKKIEAESERVYIDCQGENPFDAEGLGGKMKYFPEHQGIPFHYFPYKQTPESGTHYQSPMVAVKFKGLERGVLYHVQCKLWAKGVRHSKKDRAGLVHFEIFLDEKIRE